MDTPKKKAQTQLDKMLAEVSRLKTVGIEIEEANKEALLKGNSSVDELNKSIADLAFQESEVISKLKELRKDITTESKKKNEIKEKTKLVHNELSKLDAKIKEKQVYVFKLIQDKDKVSEGYSKQKLEKSKELESLDRDIVQKRQKSLQEEAVIKIHIKKKKKELSCAEESISNIKLKEDALSKKMNDSVKNADEAERRQVIAEKKENECKAIIETINVDIEANIPVLRSLKKEIELEKDELKKVTIDRINSKKYMEELKNKETNLKRKYEDVGLEYKQ